MRPQARYRDGKDVAFNALHAEQSSPEDGMGGQPRRDVSKTCLASPFSPWTTFG
jgi:hypothetical protein